MGTKHILLLFIILLFQNFKSQDTIHFLNHDRLTVKIIEINPENINYKLYSNQNGGILSASKSKIYKLCYANGASEIFNNALSEKWDSLAESKPTVIKDFDTLVLNNGDKLPVKINSIENSIVKYKTEKNPDGPLYTIKKTDLAKIIFSTGLNQNLSQPTNNNNNNNNNNNTYSTPVTATSGESLVQQGRLDAKRFYRKNGGSVGCGIVTVLSPLIGLIPTALCSSIEPKERNLGYPSAELWNNSDYQWGYKTQAHKIKKKKLWRTFGICTLISLGITVLLNGA